MTYSVRKITTLMVTMLIVVTLGSSIVGYYFLQNQYRTAEDHYEAEARNRLEQAANAVSNQLKLYQEIVDSLASRQTTSDMLSFAEVAEIEQWTQNTRKLLPGTLGSALANEEGEIIGDTVVQRIGSACSADIKRFQQHEAITYPAFHNNVKTLEHFDLMAYVNKDDPESSGMLIMSFTINELTKHLSKIAYHGDTLTLSSADGQVIAQNKEAFISDENLSLSTDISGTNWQIQLLTKKQQSLSYFKKVIAGNLLLVILVGFIVAYSSQRFSRVIHGDLITIRRKLDAVLEDNFIATEHTPRLEEVATIMPSINRLAETLQERNRSLHEQSISDPLTGLYNRRHFDIVMQHIFENSRRHAPAVLLLIDVNDFKTINDVLGHNAGDAVLSNIAQLLRRSTRASDEISRLGGDEFGLILQDLKIKEILPWVERFTAQYDKNVEGKKSSLIPNRSCSLSIGVCLIDANQYGSPADVIHAADMAMYKAKSMKNTNSTFVTVGLPDE